MLHFKKIALWALAALIVLSAVGCASKSEEPPKETEPPVVENNELKDKFPNFFDLDTTNGLTVFVAMFSPNGYSCSVYPTGQIDTDADELLTIHHANLEEMKEILASYEIAPESITVTPYVNLLSSYMAPELFDDGAIPQLRYKLGIGPAPEVVVEDTTDGPFSYNLCWAGQSSDGEYALRYTYYPITGMYDYKYDKTYVAVGIKNAEELEGFLSLAERYFSLSASMPNKETFHTLVKTYDEAFFQEKGIVVIYIPSESTSIGYKLADAVLEGEELHLTVTESRPEGELSANAAGWFMTLEIPQEILAEANYFTAG